MKKLRVLVACEFSGIVREAFIKRGHDAVSCDLLPTERPGPHIQDDVLKYLDDGWDMMIAHPPCTYLSYVGNRHWNKPGRKEEREKAFIFFMNLYNCGINRICIENPKGYPMTAFRKPDQIIQPYYFGDRAFKTTCLWLKNLPCLSHYNQNSLFGDTKTHTEIPKAIYTLKTNGKKIHHTEAINGWKKRSIFWPGIAAAMADQWG